MAGSKLFSKLSKHTMQLSSSITPMITLNESSLSGLVRTSVTNNWIVYRIEGAVESHMILLTPHDMDGLLRPAIKRPAPNSQRRREGGSTGSDEPPFKLDF